MEQLRVLGMVVMLLSLNIAGATAQRRGPALDPQPEEPQIQRMMQTMADMSADMTRLRGEMHGMQGMGPMQHRMDRMMARMAEMHSMMERHRQQMMERCPALGPPARESGDALKPGG